MPKTCPKPRRTPCDGAWPYEKEDCCYKRLPKASGTKTSRKASTSSKTRKPATNNASKAARKIAQSAMKKATQGPTVADLRADAKAKKIKGFSTMTKAQLVKALEGSGSSASPAKGSASASAKGNASVSTKGSTSASAKGNASVSTKGSTSVSTKGSVSDSVSPVWLTFVKKSWKNLANDDSGAFSSKTEMVMNESTARFVAEKLLRNVKKIGDGAKSVDGSMSLEKRLIKFEKEGIKQAMREPNLKKRIETHGYENAFDAMLEASMERGWTYSEIEPRDLETDYFVTEPLLKYVVSAVSGLETVPPSKSVPISLYLVAIAQIMVESLVPAAIVKEENGKVVEVKVTEDSIQTKAKEDVLLYLFYV